MKRSRFLEISTARAGSSKLRQVVQFGCVVGSILSLVACGASDQDAVTVDDTPTGGLGGGGSAGAGGAAIGGGGSSAQGGSAGLGGGGAGIAGAGFAGSGLSGASAGVGGGMAGAGNGGQSGGTSVAGTAGEGSGGVAGNAGSSGGGAGAAGTGGSAGAGAGGAAGSSGAAGSGGNPNACQVGPVPEAIRQSWDVNPFYQKYADANGIPILSSAAPPDNTLVLACQLVIEMVSMRDDVRLALIDNQVFFAMLGVDEQTNEIPEYSYLDDSINTRARGLGGNPGLCAEESILCGSTDRWRGESICVHEFAHTISLYGLYDADPTFEDRLRAAYQSAESAGLFENTYAMENEQEYWGEGVQDWYYTNLESATPNGVHGPIDKREELESYDPVLYDLIGELLSPDVSWDDCYRDG